MVAEGIEHVTDKNTLNNYHKKKWFSPALKRIHINICLAYKNYKASNFSNEFKRKFYELKKQFRIQKRLLIKLKDDRNLQLINKYFSLSKDDFWKKIKQLGYSSNNINIPIETLKAHYEELFNKKHNIKPEVQKDEDKKFKENCEKFKKEYYDFKLEPAHLSSLILDLPNGKACGLSNLTYEHLKHCSSYTFLLYLSKMYEVMIKFSVVPENFNLSVLKPLIKDPKLSSESTDNLRPVAISEVLANLFEKILLWELRKYHVEADEQFGFKGNSSCSHAIKLLKLLIKICNLRLRKCFICMLDASKAFDKVERVRLWNKLFDFGVNVAIIFAIIAYYDASEMVVINGNDISHRFKTTNGVRQGGILSPKLYNIYSQKLIEVVKKLGLGVILLKLILGIIMYADDLTLVADNESDLQAQIDAVGVQGEIDDIKFNAKKEGGCGDEDSRCPNPYWQSPPAFLLCRRHGLLHDGS